MLINLDKYCTILFGDAATFPIGHKTPEFIHFCETLLQKLSLETLVFNKQIHSISGQFIDRNVPQGFFFKKQGGDWLMTSRPGVGIGVLTADCLPIIFYEPNNHLIAIAHAGWRGSAQQIAVVVLNEFKRRTTKTPFIIFGPCAQNCCYEVQDDFIQKIEQTSQGKKAIIKRDNKLFFDNIFFNKLQLIAHGANPKQIDSSYSLCTMCNHRYHSFRREENKTSYKTQGTIVWLTH